MLRDLTTRRPQWAFFTKLNYTPLRAPTRDDVSVVPASTAPAISTEKQAQPPIPQK